MDDYNASTLYESRNEWTAKLENILTPLIIEGFQSIFAESFELCVLNKEKEKYLVTFQNCLSRIPKWNQTIIEKEKKRILDKSGCSYLEELITCVHIIKVKDLSAMRTSEIQKKISIEIPKIDNFIHKIYIHCAREIFQNVYLFENNISSLDIQKNNRSLKCIIRECIVTSVRESIPYDKILKAYMSESVEDFVTEEIKDIQPILSSPPQITEPIIEPILNPSSMNILNSIDNPTQTQNIQIDIEPTSPTLSEKSFSSLPSFETSSETSENPSLLKISSTDDEFHFDELESIPDLPPDN
jgi:hypothetical protein